MLDPKTTILDAIYLLLQRRAEEAVEVSLDSDLFEGLMFDSLEVAELSSILEDGLGTDPFSCGLIPRTVGEIIGFYEQPAG